MFDEFALYGRALDAEEVLEHYAVGVGAAQPITCPFWSVNESCAP